MVKLPDIKACYLIGFFVSVSVFVGAIYLQVEMGLAPCPLCQLQRLFLLLVGLAFLLAALQDPKGLSIRIYGFLGLLFSGFGVLVAGRHLYLQFLPSGEAPSCVAGLDYLLNTLPIAEVIKMTLRGNDICAQVGWQFLGLSIPAWSLLFFVFLGLLSILQIWRIWSLRSASRIKKGVL